MEILQGSDPVLLVEDNPGDAELTMMALSRQGLGATASKRSTICCAAVIFLTSGPAIRPSCSST